MKAYVPPLEGRRSGSNLLLDFNERTMPPSKEVVAALQKFAQEGNLQIYPEYNPLIEKLSAFINTDRDYLMLSNGSDNAIDTAFRTYLSKGDKIIIPQPSFTMFAHSANLQEAEILTPSYTFENGYPLKEVKELLKTQQVKICVICNPNNPTGSMLDQEDIQILLGENKQVLFLIDEAYFEFINETSLPLVQTNENVIVTRTFSKAMGIPALRFGYLLAQPSLINEMIKVRGPYAVNMMSVTAAMTSIDHQTDVSTYVDEVMNISKPMMEMFYQSKNINFWPSGCNFHLIEKPIDNLDEKLAEKNIRVRDMKYPGYENTIRISIGTKEDTEKILAVLNSIL